MKISWLASQKMVRPEYMWLSKAQPHILSSRLVTGDHFLFMSTEEVSVCVKRDSQ
jgi:hypothetical protein